MDIYKKASRLALRVNTNKGSLTVEQLWNLSLPNLANTIKAKYEELKKNSGNDDLAFLGDTFKEVDEVDKLSYDILVDIFKTKKEEQLADKKAAENKLHNEQILAKIKDKQDKELDNKTIEELHAMLK